MAFDLMLAIQQYKKGATPENAKSQEGRANSANGANNPPSVSTISTFSTGQSSKRESEISTNSTISTGVTPKRDFAPAPVVPLNPVLMLADDDQLEPLPEDLEYLNRMLAGCYRHDRQRLVDGYRAVWLEAMETTRLKPHQRQNAGRRAANQWLREQMQRTG